MAADTTIASGSVGAWRAAQRHQRSLQLQMHDRHLLLAVGDGFVALAAVPAAALLWHGLLHQPARFEWFMPLYYAGAWVLSLLLVDGYSLQIPISRVRSLSSVAKAAPPMVAFSGILFFVFPYQINRPVAILSVGLGVVGLLTYRLTAARLLLNASFALRALVIGRDHASDALREALVGAHHEFNVVGTFAIEDVSNGFTGTQVENVRLRMAETGATEVVLSDEAASLAGLVEACLQSGIRVTPVAAIVELYHRRVRLADVNKEWFLHVSGEAFWRRPYALVRRFIDLLLCAALGIPFLAALPLLALAIKLESPGPVFLRQLRLGQFGKPIQIIKLRSMRADAEANGAQWAARSDARITRVGRILRRTRLDEFCQLWNVLRGEMTLIGPRPERPEFIDHLAEHLPHYRARMMVKPGLTGWAQVRHGYTANLEETVAKLEYDLYYVKNQSLALDLQILALTMFTVLGLRGR
jgi:exopolysaccharide biosynthesis polyprenyl glycosylphosphotransferase